MSPLSVALLVSRAFDRCGLPKYPNRSVPGSGFSSLRISPPSPLQKSHEIARSKSPLPDIDSSPPSQPNHNSDRPDFPSARPAPPGQAPPSHFPPPPPCPHHHPTTHPPPAHSPS